MSNAKRCDRCHGFFDPCDISDDEYTIRFRNPVLLRAANAIAGTVDRYLDITAGPDGYLDLCPECSRKYINFMYFPIEPEVREPLIKKGLLTIPDTCKGCTDLTEDNPEACRYCLKIRRKHKAHNEKDGV